MKETFLSVCSSFDGEFTISNAIHRCEERGADVDQSPETFKSILRSSSSFVQVKDETFESLASIFNGARFYINPLPDERSQNFLLLGHRSIPYYHPSVENSNLVLTDDFGKELSRRKRELPWHIVKKYNVGAPFTHQVVPENVDVPAICQELLNRSSVSGTSLYPDIERNEGGEDLAYHLDMEMSEKQLKVNTYEYQIPAGKMLEARVKNYDEGVLSIRPVERSPEQQKDRSEEFHEKLVETVSESEVEDHKVFPLLTSVFSRHRQFLKEPGNHWVHVVLNSSRLRLSQPGVDPKIKPVSTNSEIRSDVTDALMNSEFDDELQHYEDHPEELVEDAREAHSQGDRKAELYLWFIEKIGTACQDPLLDLMKSDSAEDVVFAVTALESIWTDELEQPLKFIASDDRLPEETRNGAMYLLVNLGSEEAREYTARMVQDSEMVREQTRPEDLFETFVNTPEARIELLRSEEPEQEAMLKELIKVQNPRLIFIGATLVYSSRKQLREIGREALMRSGVPLVREFFHDLQDSPLDPLKQLSGTPLVNGEKYQNEDAGQLKQVLMSNFETDGSFMTVFQAEVNEIDHLLFLQQSENNGILDAHYVTMETEEEPEQLLQQASESSDVEPLQVDARFARDITLQSEHQTLDEFQKLPDEYKYGKILMYLPGGMEEHWEAYETFIQETASCSDESLHSFCRGNSFHTMKNYVPLCAFEDHDPRRSMKEKQPTELCDSFQEQLANRYKQVGYLLYQNNYEDLAKLAVESHRRLQRAGENQAPILNALNENLDEFQESFAIDPDAVPDVLGDIIEDVD